VIRVRVDPCRLGDSVGLTVHQAGARTAARTRTRTGARTSSGTGARTSAGPGARMGSSMGARTLRVGLAGDGMVRGCLL